MKTLTIILILCDFGAVAQKLYSDLPIGPHAVGFKIVTIIDSSRVAIPEYNFAGQKNSGNRHKQITAHVWYPARAGNKPYLTVRDYASHNALTSTSQRLPEEKIAGEVNAVRGSIANFFGTISDESWSTLASYKLLAQVGLEPIPGKTPLLIGLLRPFSTTVTNEMLASNGFTVLMIRDSNTGSFKSSALIEIPDFQFAVHWATKGLSIDEKRIGTFGFSGSGFTPVLFGMFDKRVKAMADIESAIFAIDYGDSDYYDARKVTMPFMHIYNRELALRDTHFSEFQKMKFSKRYHVILNQTKWHHWNVATEGYLSCTVLKNRGEEQENIRMSFVIANIYLLNFFNCYLKPDEASAKFLAARSTLPAIPDRIWDVRVLDPIQQGPTIDDFEMLLRAEGIEAALKKVRPTLQTDSLSGIWTGFQMNRLGYKLLQEKKYDDAIGVFALNSELHPQEVNWMDSLAEAYELRGDKVNMIKYSKAMLELLAAKKDLTEFEKALKGNAEKRLK